MSKTTGETARRRSPRLLIATVLGGLAVAVGIGWVAVTSLHDPPSTGSYSVPMTNAIVFSDDPSTGENQRFVIFGRKGDTAAVVYAVRNDGPLPLALQGPGDLGRESVAKLEWSPAVVEGSEPDLTRRSLPVTVEPDNEITLWVDVTKPTCRRGQDSTLRAIGLRWSVLGRVRESELDLADSSRPLTLCEPDLDTDQPLQTASSDLCALLDDLVRDRTEATADPGRAAADVSCR